MFLFFCSQEILSGYCRVHYQQVHCWGDNKWCPRITANSQGCIILQCDSLHTKTWCKLPIATWPETSPHAYMLVRPSACKASASVCEPGTKHTVQAPKRLQPLLCQSWVMTFMFSASYRRWKSWTYQVPHCVYAMQFVTKTTKAKANNNFTLAFVPQKDYQWFGRQECMCNIPAKKRKEVNMKVQHPAHLKKAIQHNTNFSHQCQIHRLSITSTRWCTKTVAEEHLQFLRDQRCSCEVPVASWKEQRFLPWDAPPKATVTTRRLSFLVRDPYKPSLPTATGRRNLPGKYTHAIISW